MRCAIDEAYLKCWDVSLPKTFEFYRGNEGFTSQ